MKLRLVSISMLALFVFASCKSTSTQPTPVTYSGVWNVIPSPTGAMLVIGQFLNSSTGFASGASGVFVKSGDSGSTWSLGGSAPTGGTIYGISFLNATTGFAVGDQLDISRTTDGGMTWQAMNASNDPATDKMRSLYFTNQNNGFLGTANADGSSSNGSICGSTDGGQTWNPIITTSNGIYNINFIPGTNGQNGVALGRGVAYFTSNGGTTWTAGTIDQPNGLTTRSTFTSATTGFAVGYPDPSTTSGYILRTDDGGHTWRTVFTSSLFGLGSIANNGAGVITAVGFGGIVVESTDGGATWEQSFAGSNRWLDVEYASQHRAVLFGANGDIDTRDK